MKNLTFIVALLVLAGCSNQAMNDRTSSAGYEKAKACIACHGDNGINGKQGVPPIGNMTAEELITATAKLTEMHFDKPILAHSVTDDDARDIARYFAEVNK